MKSKTKRIIAIIFSVVIAAVLFVPVLTEICGDGGTRVYSALTYKIISWNRLTDDMNMVYSHIKFYTFGDLFRSTEELWEKELPSVEYLVQGKILELDSENQTALIEPLPEQKESEMLLSMSTEELDSLDVSAGDYVDIIYKGPIQEIYPGKINAVEWKISSDLRFIPYTGEEWLDKSTASKLDSQPFDAITVTRIFEDCYFAETGIPYPMEIKINDSLFPDFGVGSTIYIECDNIYYDEQSHRVEADFRDMDHNYYNNQPCSGDDVCYKPVIYLYPETETEVSVNIELNGRLTCTYPSYENGWTVTASPDGTLKDKNGQTYNYLYWEGNADIKHDFSKGFCVKGCDTAEFLENSLAELGLNRREANEFIVFWLPKMEQNPYNIISFQTDAYTDASVLDISPEPDTLIRVFMSWYPSRSAVNIPSQKLSSPERTGFTAVEWGGTEIIKNK